MLPYLALASRSILAAIFVMSVATKLRTGATRREFVLSVRSLAGTNLRRSVVLAACSIVAELGIVALLAFPVSLSAGFVAAALLLAAYSAILVRALQRGVQASCHCIGSSTGPIHPWLVGRNIGLILVSVIGLAGIHSPLEATVTVGVVASLAAALAVLIVVSTFDDFVFLFAG